MSKKPISPKRIDPEHVFRFAEACADAIKFLQPQHEHFASTPIPPRGLHISIIADMMPTMMLETFAAELYFKCLHAMDHGTLVYGHAPGAIYKKLKRRKKKMVRDNHLLLGSRDAFISQLSENHRRRLLNFRSYLAAIEKSFAQVRYLFERLSPDTPRDDKPTIPITPLLRFVARRTIQDVMPDWFVKR
jgi:hypothetical protein